MRTHDWTTENIPDQKGKIVLITGASSGLGKEATKVLAIKNASIIMAVRNTTKANAVAAEIKNEFPNAKIDVRSLDLTDLQSIKSFAIAFEKDYKNLHILINNAGIMMCPFSKTKDGFEIQMGTNHLGHFALTGLLMPLLLSTNHSRVVITSSVAHKSGDINFDDLNWEKRKYKTNNAYSDSKIANLYFLYELVRKFKDNENAPIFTASHPGWTKTELDRHSGLASFLGNIVAQTVQMGTLPTLRAATDESAKSGNYYGPTKLMEMRGFPELVQSNKLSHEIEKAKKLWDLSEQLTKIRY